MSRYPVAPITLRLALRSPHCNSTSYIGDPNTKKRMNKTPENIIQLIIAALVVLGGMVLLHVGIQIDPAGEIHETVLVAFGEAATFAGSIMGIDYHYKRKGKDNNDSSTEKRD